MTADGSRSRAASKVVSPPRRAALPDSQPRRGQLLQLTEADLSTVEWIAQHAVGDVDAAGALAAVVSSGRRGAAHARAFNGESSVAHVAHLRSRDAALMHALEVVRTGVMRLVVVFGRTPRRPSAAERVLLQRLSGAATRHRVVVLLAGPVD